MRVEMVTKNVAYNFLKRAIDLASSLESEISPLAGKKRSTLVGFGLLIRNRRLAQAIFRLGSNHAYEGRMLLRSMIEIHINYAWVRLRNRERRANRFLKFEPLEMLNILKDLSNSIEPAIYSSNLKKYKSERAKFRHLFRTRNKDGKLRWENNWARGLSLKDRLKAVLQDETGKSDNFLYAIYGWSSSAIHGGPASISEVLEKNVRLQSKIQPEKDPSAQIKGAIVVLMATIEALAEDSGVFENFNVEIKKLENDLKTLKM
jgi:hypothetical protein